MIVAFLRWATFHDFLAFRQRRPSKSEKRTRRMDLREKARRTGARIRIKAVWIAARPAVSSNPRNASLRFASLRIASSPLAASREQTERKERNDRSRAVVENESHDGREKRARHRLSNDCCRNLPAVGIFALDLRIFSRVARTTYGIFLRKSVTAGS